MRAIKSLSVPCVNISRQCVSSCSSFGCKTLVVCVWQVCGIFSDVFHVFSGTERGLFSQQMLRSQRKRRFSVILRPSVPYSQLANSMVAWGSPCRARSGYRVWWTTGKTFSHLIGNWLTRCQSGSFCNLIISWFNHYYTIVCATLQYIWGQITANLILYWVIESCVLQGTIYYRRRRYGLNDVAKHLIQASLHSSTTAFAAKRDNCRAFLYYLGWCLRRWSKRVEC